MEVVELRTFLAEAECLAVDPSRRYSSSSPVACPTACSSTTTSAADLFSPRFRFRYPKFSGTGSNATISQVAGARSAAMQQYSPTFAPTSTIVLLRSEEHTSEL